MVQKGNLNQLKLNKKAVGWEVKCVTLKGKKGNFLEGKAQNMRPRELQDKYSVVKSFILRLE